MSAAKNIQRDGYWIQPKTSADLTWPTASNINAATFTVNAKTALHTDSACASSRAGMTVSASQLECIGVYFAAPPDDNIPFRVKADLNVVGQSGTFNNQAVVIGYGPASPTGSDDVIDEPFLIPFDQQRFDDLIVLPPLDSGDANYGRPIFFGVAHLAGQSVTSLFVIASISVQNLGVRPPTMHFMVP
ncbi:MAG: hypothetical protein HKN34_03005 [Gammaproteobacteria bacterium]|nr:hypothetical protein [Gammaproteobacteria bacterium]